MAEWSTAGLPFLAALLVFLVPGACIGLAAGIRSMSMLSLAPVLSVGVVSVSALAAPFLGLSWGLIPVAVGTVVTGSATWAIRAAIAWKAGWRRAEIRWSYVATVAGAAALVVGFGVILFRLARIFGSPTYVSQTADNIFHLNAVRFILETGNASSLGLGAATGGSPVFYPGAWHDLAALIVEASGAEIPAAVACLNLVIGAVVWPLSMWFFCRTVLGGSIAMNVGFGVLVSSFSAFPYLLIDWGVIYPNYLGIAALPAVAAIVVMACRNGVVLSRRGAMLPWLGLVGLAAIGLSHPNTVITLMVVTVPYLLARVLRRSVLSSFSWRLGPKAYLKAGLSLVLVASLAAAWVILRPFPISSFSIWPPYQSGAQAVGEALLTTHSARGAAWATGGLLILGLLFAFAHRGLRWLAWSWLAWTALFVVVTAWQPSLVHAFLTGGWYDDYRRIAAGLTLVALPLAILGFVGLYKVAIRAARKLPRLNTKISGSLALALIALPVFFVAQTGAIRNAAVVAQTNYSLRPGSPIMSLDEQDLYEELTDLVPKDKVIAGNPWDGSAWAFLVSGRKVLFPHVQPAMDADKALIARSFNAAASNPDVCSAAKRLGVEYAINSDELIYLPGNPNNLNYPGLEHLDRAPGFKQIAHVGGNRLYELIAC